jgi:carboxyl-terminal processing protease
MVNSEVGYIKINRFAATTVEEFMTAMDKLENQGMKKLILDLRGNPGGYLDAAIRISDEFLAGRKLLVYTKGKSRPKTEYFSEIEGTFESGKLVVMVDEGSASASEIVSGAVQDWDRATIVGRRSFGKGLVQEQTVFPDGSGMRLTIARYYTPTGRSIQKPYSEGYDAYENEVDVRFKHGELLNKDSIRFSDSLSYKTPAGKIVYGGGGIMPDVFVPIDTTNNSDYLNKIFGLGVLSQFAYDYVDANRISLKKYTSASQFKKEFVITESLINEFVTYASNKGVSKEPIAIAHSLPVIKLQVKAYIARLIWQNEGLYPILHEGDMAFKKALEQLK